MPRYEGMDDLLARLSERLAPSEPAPPVSPTSVAENATYTRSLAELATIQRHAEMLRAALGAGGVETLSRGEQADLLARLGTVLHALWACETTLQTQGPAR